MNSDWPVLAGLGVLALLALMLAVVLLRTWSRTRRDLAAARAETTDLRLQVQRLEQRLAVPAQSAPRDAAEYTITDLARPEDAPVAPPMSVDRVLFADLVLRESVVKAASFAHGVRRALSAESRNRIRFEVRREVRRARKQRRADTRVAVREWRARQRAALQDAASDGSPAA